MVTIGELQEAVKDFYEMTVTPEFSKTLKLNKLGERRLLPLFGAFLHGRFSNVEREIPARKRKKQKGRIDFEVDKIAIELAVRKPKAPKAGLSKAVNGDEIYKLQKHKGRMSALVLLDYSRNSFDEDELESFRQWDSVGKGNHNLKAINLIYCHRSQGEIKTIYKNIRTEAHDG